VDFRIKVKLPKSRLVSPSANAPIFRRAALRVHSNEWIEEQRRRVVSSATRHVETGAQKLGFLVRTVERLRPARRKIATAVVAVLTIWLGVHVMFGPNGTVAYRHKRAEARDLQQQIDSLEKENAALSGQITALQTDPKAIEKEAREQLHYARPDEVIYVAPYHEQAAPPASHAARK
jgi:cell division protein FtsB